MTGFLELPHNFEAEQALLGAILMNNPVHASVVEIVRTEHFADPLHGRLFEIAGRLIERGQMVSVLTLKTMAEQDEGLKAVGGPAYLARLAATSVHVQDAPSMARMVRDCAVRRGLIAATSDAMAGAYDTAAEHDVGEQIETLEQRLYDLAEGATGEGIQPFHRALTEAVKSAEAAHQRDGLSGLSTGLRDLDELLGGLHRSNLEIVASRPGMGKTALGTGMAFAAAKAGQAVGFFSLEMSAEQLGLRIIAEQAGLSSDRIRKGELSAKEMDRVLSAAHELEAIPLYIDDTPGMSIAGLRTRARRLKRKHGLGLVVVDYLQLIEASKRQKENRVQEVSEITRGLKTLAKELDVPVLALSQLSRNVEQRSDKRPLLSDLRDSGSIEQDADTVIFIYREEYYRRLQGQDPSDVRGQAELNIAKHRHGPTGLVHLSFDGATTTFKDQSARGQE
jgi:replicative DNA helicase